MSCILQWSPVRPQIDIHVFYSCDCFGTACHIRKKKKVLLMAWFQIQKYVWRLKTLYINYLRKGPHIHMISKWQANITWSKLCGHSAKQDSRWASVKISTSLLRARSTMHPSKTCRDGLKMVMKNLSFSKTSLRMSFQGMKSKNGIKWVLHQVPLWIWVEKNQHQRKPHCLFCFGMFMSLPSLRGTKAIKPIGYQIQLPTLFRIHG